MSRFRSLEFEGGREKDRPSRRDCPRDEAFYLDAARDLFEQGEFEPALRMYARTLEENAGSIPAWVGQTRMLIEMGRFEEAKAWVDKALDRDPEHPELLACKAVALARLGDLDAALAFSDASIAEGDKPPYVWLARADVLLARGEDRAEYCLDKASALATRQWSIAWMAARLHMYYGRFACALRWLQRAIESDAGHYVAWHLRGECEAALGYSKLALASFQQALTLNPECRAARHSIVALRQSAFRNRIAGWWRRLAGR